MGMLDKLFGRKTDAAPAHMAPDGHPCGCGHDHGHGHDHEHADDPGVPVEMGAAEVRARMAAEPRPVLLDVREAHELAAEGWIPGSLHVPMSQIERRVEELDLSKPHVVYCAGGVRSFDVGFFLLQNGCREVVNLSGGIRAWDGERARK